MKLKFLILIFYISLLPLTSSAQRWKLRRIETSIGFGTSHFHGDIGGTADVKNGLGFKDIQFEYTKPSLAFGIAYKVAGDMNVKMNLIYGFIKGDDINSRNSERNLAFTSTIFEPSFQFEYYLISESSSFSSSAQFNRRGMVNNYAQFYLYGFGGLGGVFSNVTPEKELISKIDNNFSKFGIVFPIGLGLKYTIDAKWSLGLEFGRRFTLSDYIDGYSSKFSKHKDTYYIGLFSAIYKIRTDRRGRPIFGRAFRF